MPLRITYCLLTLLVLSFPSLTTAAEDKTGGKLAPKPAPVIAGQAVRGRAPILLPAIGAVEASEVVEIKTRVTGLLREVHFEEGQDVRQGDPLFSLDARDLDAALRSAKADLDRYRAQLAKAEEDKRRHDGLLRQGIISKDQQETTTTALNALQAEIRAAEAAVEAARIELSFAEIRSPISGRTGVLQANAGNMIKANADKPMVVISRVEPVHVRFSAPEAHLAAIMAAQAAAPLVVRAKPAGTADAVAGKLYFIDSAVDASTGSIVLKARFDNAARTLWPGQFVDVTLEVGALDNVVLVPAQAVTPGADGEFVYVIRPDKTVEYRPVKTGQLHDGRVVVTSGLDGGETVVLEGHLRLAPGAAVTIRPEKGEDSSASNASSAGAKQ